MTDHEQLEQLYREMYAAMIRKDRAALSRIHDDSFLLRHMTGMRQTKQVYIESIMNGTLNYYDEKTESLSISVHGDRATMRGHSRVTAAVFGGGKHTWPLALNFELRKTGGEWKLTRAEAATY